MTAAEITKDIYLVGSADITDPKDCSIYLLNLGGVNPDRYWGRDQFREDHLQHRRTRT